MNWRNFRLPQVFYEGEKGVSGPECALRWQGRWRWKSDV